MQPGSWVLALEYAYLLTQGNKLKPEVVTRSEERTEPTEETPEEREHGSVYITGRDDRPGPGLVDKLLILRADRILATHNPARLPDFPGELFQRLQWMAGHI